MEIGLPDVCPSCGSTKLKANTDGIIHYSKSMVKDWYLRIAEPHEQVYSCFCYNCKVQFTHPKEN